MWSVWDWLKTERANIARNSFFEKIADPVFLLSFILFVHVRDRTRKRDLT